MIAERGRPRLRPPSVPFDAVVIRHRCSLSVQSVADVAIFAGGGEDRSLLANAGIGIIGWAAAWLIVTLLDGEPPDEVTIGIGLLALVCSIAFIYLIERRNRSEPPSAT